MGEGRSWRPPLPLEGRWPGPIVKAGSRKEREKALQEVNLLELAPRRVADWEEVEGRVVVIRPEPRTRGLRGWLDRFFHRMSARRVRLDEVGSLAWDLFDGDRTVREVAEGVREEFGPEIEPVEERLGHLVWIMRREGFLDYPGWDEGS